MKKRAGAFLICLVLVLSVVLVPTVSMAADRQTGGTWYPARSGWQGSTPSTSSKYWCSVLIPLPAPDTWNANELRTWAMEAKRLRGGDTAVALKTSWSEKIVYTDAKDVKAGVYTLCDFYYGPYGSADKTNASVNVRSEVTVKSGTGIVKVKGVKLNTTKKTVLKGKTVQLKTTVSPAGATNKAVTWKSSNKKIATVNSAGKVKGIAPGKATITVKTKDGSKTAKCVVTVKQGVTSIKLAKTKATLKKGRVLDLGKGMKVSPSKAANKKVKWVSCTPEIAKVDKNGKVTALKPGLVKITATAADGSGKKAICMITVKK